MASAVDWILSASASLISSSNSSSKAITSSTASSESRPRSEEKTDVAVTLDASTLSNFFTTSNTRLSTSARDRPGADCDDVEEEEEVAAAGVAAVKEREMEGVRARERIRVEQRRYEYQQQQPPMGMALTMPGQYLYDEPPTAQQWGYPTPPLAYQLPMKRAWDQRDGA